ncbi:hypothetical protein [Marinicrinis sediminis]|uniref:YgiT-type zinc finger protein n=1 Tax=Marinicrinis sediminis TaxID=1652465 RepID=A0ABW5R892_9BACL
MSFCCGASMIGTRGTLKHLRSHIHNVPLMYCPVCHRVEVHHEVETEYEILAEYAHADGAQEVDFEDYVPLKDRDQFYENCVNTEKESPLDLITNQIDIALDLLSFAKKINDDTWVNQLHHRLKALGKKKTNLIQSTKPAS